MKKSVLMVFEGMSYGGAERHIVDLSNGIQNKAGRKVIVATQGGPLEQELASNNITHEYIPGIRYHPTHLLKVAHTIHKLVIAHHTGILHSHSRYYNLASALAVRLFRTPAIRLATAHNVYPDKHWLGFWSDPTLCVSNAAAEYVRNHARVSTNVILNGIPPLSVTRTRDDIRKSLGISPEAIVILNVGRLGEQKAQELLLESFSNILGYPGIPPLHLLIAGDGELKGKLENNIKQSNLGQHVSLLGNRSDIGNLMTASDIFALSSRWEGLGIVLIEAASFRLPLVSFNVGGVVEVVRDKETGLLVKPGDTRALGEALARLARDPELRLKLGESGRAHYLKNFTIDKCVNETDEFYSSLG